MSYIKKLRYFAQLNIQLNQMAEEISPGQLLHPPELLQKVMINGKRLCFMKMGLERPEPAIIFIHGFGGFFMDWPKIMVPISKHRKCFAIDLPGWGFSEAYDDHHQGLESEVETIQNFIRSQGLSEVILVGLSYGAAVSWACAAEKMPEVKKLLLLNPMPPHPMRFMHSLLYRMIFHLNRSKIIAKVSHRLMLKDVYDRVVRETLFNPNVADKLYTKLGFLVLKQPHLYLNMYHFAHKAKHLNWSDWEAKIKQNIDIPVHIIQALEDRIFTLKSAQYLQNLMPQSTLQTVNHCGHAMNFEKSKYIAKLILELSGEESQESAA